MATKFSKKIALTVDCENLRFITVTLIMLKNSKINAKNFSV